MILTRFSLFVAWMTLLLEGNIIAREGFQTLEDLGIMEDDKDVIEMAKRMASHSNH